MWYDYALLFPCYDILIVAGIALGLNIRDMVKAFPKPPEIRITGTVTINLRTGQMSYTERTNVVG